MKKRVFSLLLTSFAVVIISVFLTKIARACGPFFPKIIFVNTLHPDFPIRSYADGNLGVIQPTYGSLYLYAAYRDLNAMPIRPSEQQQLWGAQVEKLGTEGNAASANRNETQQAPRPQAQPPTSAQVGPENSPFADYEAQPTGVFGALVMKADDTSFSVQFLNCPEDAFHQAATTYRDRAARFGASSPIVQAWVEAQQTVFANCAASGPGTIPEDLPSSAPALARADRFYQIAAAHFYARHYDEAIAEFRAIAQDSSSPWSAIAPYLVARAMVRKATLIPSFKIDLDTLAQAETQVDSVVADPRLKQYHRAASRLRGFIEFRLHPDQRLAELANEMTKPSGDPNLEQDAIDFRLLDSRIGGSDAEISEMSAKSDFLDWLFSIRQRTANLDEHVWQKWQNTHSEAWLVAALMAADAGSLHLADLLSAADRVAPSSPAYLSATFHSLRLRHLAGEDSEVRERFGQLNLNPQGSFPKKNSTPPSTINMFLALRLAVSSNLDEFLESASRVPAMIADTSEGGDLPLSNSPWVKTARSEARFDDDALTVMNHLLPVALLAKGAASTKLPENARRDVALAAWVRAALLDEDDVARSLAPSLEQLQPDMKASIQQYNSASTPAARHFIAVLTALRFPGLRPFIMPERGLGPPEALAEIDDFRDNWWGTLGPVCELAGSYFAGHLFVTPPPSQPVQWPRLGPALQQIYPGGEMKPPSFLSATELAEAAHEWQRLLAMSPAPDYLSAQVIAWAKAHPSDPLVPEALALAVKSTRFGCTDAKTGELSRAAFALLHGRYPNSPWAQKTKYWFR